MLGLCAQQAARAIDLGDQIQIWIAVLTLAVVLWILWIEQSPAYLPFKTLGYAHGRYPLAADPRSRRRLNIDQHNRTILIDVSPRVGGECTEFSVRFQQEATWTDRLTPRDRLHPHLHAISPDIIGIDAVRVFTSEGEAKCESAQTSGGKEYFRFISPIILTPGEPFHCEVTARIGNRAWSGECSLRFKMPGVTRGSAKVLVRSSGQLVASRPLRR